MSSRFILFLKSRIFLKTLLIFFVALIAVFFLLTSFLNSFTHHGENIPVPNLQGYKISQLDSILSKHNFHYKIIDSLFDIEKTPGTIIDQDPAPKSKVKENRTIYLTINATQPPDVKMPDLVDVSFRQAEAILQSFGLLSGEITYRSDLAKNAVLEQRFKNKIIKPGTLIPKGALIDLVLGDGLADIEVPVPDLTGHNAQEAWSILKRASLTLGGTHYDEGMKDSASAKIYSQKPLANQGEMLKQGDAVDIFLH